MIGGQKERGNVSNKRSGSELQKLAYRTRESGWSGKKGVKWGGRRKRRELEQTTRRHGSE